MDSPTAAMADAKDEPALLIYNALPLGAFAVQHMIMARKPFKDYVTKHFYPSAVERSVFVLAASAILHSMYVSWTPLTKPVWEFPTQLHSLIWGFHFLGWIIMVASTFMIDHFDLFGLSPSFGKASRLGGKTLVAEFFYKWVRHPIMAGFLMAFWSAPVMTQGRLLFCLLTSGFIFLDVFFLEERDLKKAIPQYEHYTKNVGAFCPVSFLPYSGPTKKEEKSHGWAEGAQAKIDGRKLHLN